MLSIEKGARLEERITCEEYVDLLNRIKAKNLTSVTDEEKAFLVLNFMSLSIVYVDSVKEAYDTIKVLGFDKELQLAAKIHSYDKLRLQFVNRVNDLIVRGKKVNSMLNCLFKSK